MSFHGVRRLLCRPGTVGAALAAGMMLCGSAVAEGFRVSSADVAAAKHHEAQLARSVSRPAGFAAQPAVRAVPQPMAQRPMAQRASPFSVQSAPAAEADATLIARDEWEAYKRVFVSADGRVLDRENSDISHSEGQGYGMILAVHAGDRDTFDRIWRFTREELQIRNDALLAWRYHPAQFPHVADQNNATDGDILVAYALLRAAAHWNAPAYAGMADRMVRDIGRTLIGWDGGRPILKPAAFGFDAIPGNDGPVVNLSYYFYAAFELFAVVQPGFPWAELARHGEALTLEARTGKHNLVPNWVSVARGEVKVAEGFPRRASYDAVRIPLYMAYGNLAGFDMSAQDAVWNVHGSGVPADHALDTGRVHAELPDPGYRMIAALAACSARGVPIPADLMHFRPTTYFASSLHLLGLVAVRRAGVCRDRLSAVTIGSRTSGRTRGAAQVSHARHVPYMNHTFHNNLIK